jgi:two-component system copper resistance phosphate regulon response regulator CusR
MRVLIVEDEVKIARAIGHALGDVGVEVQIALDGASGLRLAREERFDAIILDWTLPELDGMEVLRGLRGENLPTPVLMLSARGQADDRIRGLDLGADDYLPKPFVLAEVVARVRALARRGQPREYRLLAHLVQAQGRVCRPAELHEKVWDYRGGYDPTSNVLAVAINRLREKVDADHPEKLIRTVFAGGYAVKAP